MLPNLAVLARRLGTLPYQPVHRRGAAGGDGWRGQDEALVLPDDLARLLAPYPVGEQAHLDAVDDGVPLTAISPRVADIAAHGGGALLVGSTEHVVAGEGGAIRAHDVCRHVPVGGVDDGADRVRPRLHDGAVRRAGFPGDEAPRAD